MPRSDDKDDRAQLLEAETPTVVRHMVLFRFVPEASGEVVGAVLAELAALPSRHPAMRRFGLGENVSERDRTFSHVMTMEFDDRAQLETYLRSPEHEAFVAVRFAPHVERRVIASYEAR